MSNTPGWIVFSVVIVGYVCLFLVAFLPGKETVSEMDDTADRGDLRKGE